MKQLLSSLKFSTQPKQSKQPKLTIGIIGNGFVGKATSLFACLDIKVIIYDKDPTLCVPQDTQLTDLLECAIIFICVPTPMKPDGSCHIAIVDSVVKQLREINYQHFIVIRSTVPVGTCERLDCYFMPEFLTESNYEKDFRTTNPWVIGYILNQRTEKFKQTMNQLLEIASLHHKIQYNYTKYVFTSEAELIKLFRNSLLATKVSFCNEIYQLCIRKNINYHTVRSIATLDSRISSGHTQVPGPDGSFGFGGTCFPKDIESLHYQMKQVGVKPILLEAVITRNKTIDRPEQEWIHKKGRAVINDESEST